MEWDAEAAEGSEVDNNNNRHQMAVVEVDISNKFQEEADSLIIREEETHNRLEETLTQWEIALRVEMDTNLKISHHPLEEAHQISKLSCADISNFVSKLFNKGHFLKCKILKF